MRHYNKSWKWFNEMVNVLQHGRRAFILTSSWGLFFFTGWNSTLDHKYSSFLQTCFPRVPCVLEPSFKLQSKFRLLDERKAGGLRPLWSPAGEPSVCPETRDSFAGKLSCQMRFSVFSCCCNRRVKMVADHKKKKKKRKQTISAKAPWDERWTSGWCGLCRGFRLQKLTLHDLKNISPLSKFNVFEHFKSKQQTCRTWQMCSLDWSSATTCFKATSTTSYMSIKRIRKYETEGGSCEQRFLHWLLYLKAKYFYDDSVYTNTTLLGFSNFTKLYHKIRLLY